MQLVSSGDTIFSYYYSLIQHLGTATGRAVTTTKPANLGDPGQWDHEGWRVPVDWRPLVTPLNPRELMCDIEPYLPAKYSPLQKSGKGLQAVYLAHLPDLMAKVLLDNITA
jgi:putative restriction endonuclease